MQKAILETVFWGREWAAAVQNSLSSLLRIQTDVAVCALSLLTLLHTLTSFRLIGSKQCSDKMN